MRRIVFCTCALSFLLAGSAAGQSWTPPAERDRCPSKWGAGDERGAANHMNPETVLRASRLIRTGEIVELGRVLSSTMPLSAGRRFHVDTKRTTMNPQSNRRGSNEELVTAEIGQVGTQFDGFAHQTIANTVYNCLRLDDIASRTGFTKLGIQHVGALFTRGVLIDVAAVKGVEMLGDAYEITVDDLQRALSRQNVTIQSGDAILVHTGWGRLWDADPARYQRGNPGIGIAAAEWLVRQNPMVIGADSAPVEVNPNPDAQLSLPVHQIMLVVNGIHLLENVKLDELAAKRIYEFALIVEPLKIQGGTGSTVAPIAVR
jgi:kynurenine formamidase